MDKIQVYCVFLFLYFRPSPHAQDPVVFTNTLHTVAEESGEYEDVREIAAAFNITSCPAYSVGIAHASHPGADQEYELVDRVQGSTAAPEYVTVVAEGGEMLIPERSATSGEERAENSLPAEQEYETMNLTRGQP